MELKELIDKLKELSDFFCEKGIEDIYTNSKIYEVLIANQLGHSIINGHANSPDAKDKDDNFYEYKHYKQSSSNHTWTFNDYTDRTIRKLNKVKSVYFVVINDKTVIPEIEEIYIVSGKKVAEYMEKCTQNIKNKRKMINISATQIKDNMPYKFVRTHDIASLHPKKTKFELSCSTALDEIFTTAGEIGKEIKVNGILTSNKLWELLVACNLGHRINSEQKKNDAYDINGKTYEYKVSKKSRWTFQDISNNVLKSYLNDEKIILAAVDKREFVIKHIVACQPRAIVRILRKKLKEKKKKSQEIRRLTASMGKEDIEKMIKNGKAEWIL